MIASAGLFPVITVHCFACPHKVNSTSPREAHDLMEAHYRARHAALIASLIGGTAS